MTTETSTTFATTPKEPGNPDQPSINRNLNLNKRNYDTIHKPSTQFGSRTISGSKSGVIHAIPQTKQSPSANQITLKRDFRPQIHRYTLRIKIIKSKSEEEEQSLIEKTLQKFLDVILQVDPKSIIPPYYQLDREDKAIPDILTSFPISSIDSFTSVKKNFSRLSARDESGHIWSSMILVHMNPFLMFMEKNRYTFENQSFSIWPKASDHEQAADIGWLLYSTRQHH
jgi:hypothetical protein